ncbi:MAG: DUF1491 family protein [Hyphomicrobiales bacterium]|uniref:DUF1491 family protein n=1 Tax=Rhabdaerophilum calidifontis TaxID=2604328 RepID=UPI00123AC44F|nr:DUF1491 family protein [Rhabdaerophilum calidifontis]MCA1998975.1 DUF1491 family protein [Hyphomicrobiales bacterium]
MARLTSDFFVSAHLRRCAAEGVFAALRRRGGAEAGAILVVVDRLDGTGTLYGPAPQSSYGAQAPGRAFSRLHKDEVLPRAEIEARLVREIDFDPDCWIIEIEDRGGRHFLDLSPE